MVSCPTVIANQSLQTDQFLSFTALLPQLKLTENYQVQTRNGRERAPSCCDETSAREGVRAPGSSQSFSLRRNVTKGKLLPSSSVKRKDWIDKSAQGIVSLPECEQLGTRKGNKQTNDRIL